MRRALLSFGLAVAALPVVSGCAGDPADQDLCAHFNDLVTAVDDVRAITTESATAAELRASAEDLQAQLDQLWYVSEGRLDTDISNLRSAVAGFTEASVDAGNEASEVAAPLLDDSLDDVNEAFGALKQSLDAQCPAD